MLLTQKTCKNLALMPMLEVYLVFKSPFSEHVLSSSGYFSIYVNKYIYKDEKLKLLAGYI